LVFPLGYRGGKKGLIGEEEGTRIGADSGEVLDELEDFTNGL